MENFRCLSFSRFSGSTSPSFSKLSVFCLIASSLLFSSCVTTSSNGSGDKAAIVSGTGRTLRVGALFPMSGKHAALGRSLLHAAKKAVTDHPNSRIELISVDSGGTSDQTQAAMTQLASQNVDVVVGPVFHDAAQSAARQASALSLPVVTLSPHQDILQAGPDAGQYVYLNAFHPDSQARYMAGFAAENGRGRVAILAPDTKSGHSMAENFADELQARGGTLVRTVYFERGAKDFTAAFKALGYKPGSDGQSSVAFDQLKGWADFNALFVPVSAQTVRLIAPQAAFFNLLMPQVALLGTAMWNSPALLAEGTDYLQGAIFCDIDTDKWNAFRNAFQKTWREWPSKLAVLSYDSVSVLAQLVRDQDAGMGSSGGLLREAGFKGIGSHIRFGNNGISQREYKLFQVDRRGVKPFSARRAGSKGYWWSKINRDGRGKPQVAEL